MAATGETDEFPVKWDDPADADLTWAYNPMHQPDVRPPLELDLVNRPFMQGFGMALTELGFETDIRTLQANYYIFSNLCNNSLDYFGYFHFGISYICLIY